MGEKLGYRPELDGIRGIAIALVVVVHAFGEPDGRLGVDMFFVLSGFLITTLLLEEQAETGRVSFRGFYERRVRRLVPALVAMLAIYLAISLPLAWAENDGGAARQALFGVLSVSTLSTNFVLAGENPFRPPVGSSLVPLWSLVAEDQFYLLWPVLLFLVLRGKRSIAGVLLLASLALVTSRQLQLFHSNHATEARLQFGADTRPVGIIVGCLLAIVYTSSMRDQLLGWAKLLTVPACAYVAWLIAHSSSQDLFNHEQLTLFALSTAVLVAQALNRGLAQLLAFRPLVALGVISYSLYLWHSLVAHTVLRLNQPEPPLVMKLVSIALSLLVATASYRLIESRFIRRRGAAATSRYPPPRPARHTAGSIGVQQGRPVNDEVRSQVPRAQVE